MNKEFAMLWRVLKNKKEFTPSKSRGYTLVELLVVMGIMAVLSILSFSGYVLFKRQMYVKHVGNQLQTDIRESFIRSIAVKDDGGSIGGACAGAGKVAKVRVLKIPITDDFKGYQMVSYCEDTTSGTLLKKSSTTINPSDAVGYRAKVVSSSPSRTSNSGFYCLAYSAPYGEFGNYWFNNISPSTGPESSSDTNDSCDDSIKNWVKKKDGSYPPPANTNSVSTDSPITFALSSSASVSQDIIIHPSGGADLTNL